MSIDRNPSPLPPAGKADLWKEAYENIRKDPDDSAVYADFREIINNERGRGQEARLSSESGRKDLLSLIDQRRDSLSAKRTSPKVQQVFTVADKARNLVSLGAAANPFSTVAVAGLFIAFDMRKMYTDASQAMLDIAIEMAGIICRAGVESREVTQQDPNEPQELLDLRDRLRGDYVQLYRTILIMTMRLVRTLSSKRRALFAGLSKWPDDRLNLEKMESRVIKSLDSVSRWRMNMPSQPPNWGIKGRNALHNAARYGQTTEVYNLIKNGSCGPAVLNGQTYRGWTALMFAIENGHYGIMDMLLECKGIDVNIRNSIGRTAVYMAALKDRSSMVRKMVQVGAKVDARDNRGRTAWLMIGSSGHLQCMKHLRAGGAELDQITYTNGYTYVVKPNRGWVSPIRKGTLTVSSALHGAVEGNQLEVVEWLVSQGIDTSIKLKAGPNAGKTAKEMAQELGYAEVEKALS